MALAPTPAGPSLEQDVHAAVNDHRATRGLRPLRWSEVVAEQAREHSRRMASGATSFGHRDFQKRVAAIGRKVKWQNAAENVAKSGSVESAVALWLRNRGHRGNIEGDFDLTGVGVARSSDGLLYFTQIFIKAK
jgi:uncharacterized protein YkwD